MSVDLPAMKQLQLVPHKPHRSAQIFGLHGMHLAALKAIAKDILLQNRKLALFELDSEALGAPL